MKYRFLSFMLGMVLIFSSLSTLITTVSAAEYEINDLNEAHKNVYASSNFTGMDEFDLYNPYEIDISDPNADYSFWHFIDSSKTSSYAEITFENAKGETFIWTVVPCKNNQHFAVITPSSWKLINGVSYAQEDGNFNLSHSGRHIGKGKVIASATVDAYYYEITPYEFYERTVDKYYEREVDEYYERTVDEYYERTVDEYYERQVDNYYERPVHEIYGRYAQRYLVPVFTRKINSKSGTLVTRLTYSDNTKKAKPINGGAFGNGHTYVKINVEEASKDGGVWFTIADSSKNNGKKTPDQYNRPIDYKYNVQIKDGQLTISFDENLVSASVGAYVVANPSQFPGNAPKHYNNMVTLNLPANNGVVYLYTHISSLNWYSDKNEYEFLEWRYDDSKTTYDTEYTLISKEYGDYELVNTEYGDYELVDTKYGDYELVDIKYGDYELVSTEYGDYELINTEYGEYKLVNSYNDKEKIDVEYTGKLTLTVNGEEKSLNEELLLEPGEYVFTISTDGGEFEPVSKTIMIEPGENEPITFEFVYTLDDVILDKVVDKSDIESIHKADKTATVHEADKMPTIHEADKTATIHEKDLDAMNHYADAEPVPVYNDEYIFLDDIKLGNENEPFGEYVVRIN